MTATAFDTASLVTQPLDPQKRVNYTFGLVLGVDEFLQEQTYFLSKHRLENRLLHGYGTVWGLKVTADTGATGPEIHVTPGVALTPAGQEICVPREMCARLNEWLASQRDALQQLYGTPSSSFSLRLAVVLCYRECLTDVVPVPGEPCRSQDDAMEPSRIADSFTLEFCLDQTEAEASPPLSGSGDDGLCRFRPSQVEEDAVRAFGALLERIVITSDAVTFVERDQLEDAVRALAGATLASPPVGGTLYLRPHEACDILRAAFRVWVTEVRPQLVAGDPCKHTGKFEQCVLLARLTVPVSGPWGEDGAGAITIDDSERPYLLHTRLLQEWLLCGRQGSGGVAAEVPARTFANAYMTDARTLRVWIHYPPLLTIPAAAVRVAVNEGFAIGGALVTQVPGTNVFDLGLSAALVDGDRVEARFDATAISDSAGHAFTDALNDPTYGFLDRLPNNELRVYATYHAAGVAPPTNASGDVTGPYAGPLRVVGISGTAVADLTATPPASGQVLAWDATNGRWSPENQRAGGAASGDLSGSYPNPMVARIRGNPVAGDAPSGGAVLTWNAGTAQWEARDPLAARTAGGDLHDTYPNPTVVGLQHQPVSSDPPADGDVLTWVQTPAPAHWGPRAPAFVGAPAGPYAIVAAGFFLAATGAPLRPSYGALRADPPLAVPADPSSREYVLRFPLYVPPPPGAAAAFIVKGTVQESEAPRPFTVTVSLPPPLPTVTVPIAPLHGHFAFVRFEADGIRVRVAGANNQPPAANDGFMVEISRIGK